MKKNKVKRTERGWTGHHICAQDCLFRRNTLLEYGKVKVVVSTVGLIYVNQKRGIETVGDNRYFETRAFHALKKDKRFKDEDVSREIEFESQWCIDKANADKEANDMHEKVIKELSKRLKNGEIK